jgi:uncharacterized membrane protein YphA (DoxX/SURF4 family)
MTNEETMESEEGRSQSQKSAFSNWQKVLLIIARLGLAYLFFTQLWWKAPTSFGCPDDYSFTTGTIQDGRIRLSRTSGLCDWLGIESYYAENRDLKVFQANLDNKGTSEVYLNLTLLRQFNGQIVDHIIMPNIRLFGWLIWLAEFSIFVLVGFGLFSRLGGLIALGVSLQLTVGLANIPSPYEWEWSYWNIVFLSIAVIATAPGRFLGIDMLLIPRLKSLAADGKLIGRIGLFLTGE